MAVDIPVLELYGMSESTGPQTISLKSSTRWRTGSCGKDMSGAETKIDNPDEDGNGEVSDVRQSFSDVKYGNVVQSSLLFGVG